MIDSFNLLINLQLLYNPIIKLSMKSNKTLDLIQVFASKEWSELKKYLLYSDNMNPQHRIVIGKLNQSNQISVEELSSKTKLPSRRVLYLLSEIQKEIENWVYEHQFMGHTKLKKLTLLLNYYSSKNLDKLTNSIYNKIESIDTVNLSALGFYDLFYFYRTLDSSLKSKLKRDKFPVSIQYLRFIDIYHAIESIKILCEERNRMNILKTVGSESQMHISRLSSMNELRSESRVLNTYLIIYELLSNYEHICEFSIETLIVSFNNIRLNIDNHVDIHSISHYIINICQLGIKNGNQKLRNKLFEFIEILIENCIFVENNLIPYSLFSLTFSNALKLDKLDWAKVFLEKYYKYIPESRRENDILILKSELYLIEDKIDEAKKKIGKINYETIDVFQRLNIYRLIIKLQLSEKLVINDYLNNTIKNMKSMLTNRDIGELNKELNENFIKNCKHLLIGNNSIKYSKTADLEWFLKICKQ